MKINPAYKVFCSPLDLEVVDLLDFKDYPILNLEQDSIGNKYLSYLSSLHDNIEQRIIIQVSQIRLNQILSREIRLIDAFNNPENKSIFIANFNSTTGEIDSNFILPSSEFISINPISDSYIVPKQLKSKSLIELDNQEMVLESIGKGKNLLDIYLVSERLKNSIKPFAIYKVFFPVIEILKSFFSIDQREVEKKFAFSRIRQKSFGFTVEFSQGQEKLFSSEKSIELELFISLFNADKKEDFIKLIESTKNEKYISEYSKIINTIIENNAVLYTAYANPTTKEILQSLPIDKAKAIQVKKIIDESFHSYEDIETIRGIFLDINLATVIPKFVIASADEADLFYKGEIEKSLTYKIKEDQINHGKIVYICTIKVIYTPQTTVKGEEIRRYLLDYQRE